MQGQNNKVTNKGTKKTFYYQCATMTSCMLASSSLREQTVTISIINILITLRKNWIQISPGCSSFIIKSKNISSELFIQWIMNNETFLPCCNVKGRWVELLVINWKNIGSGSCCDSSNGINLPLTKTILILYKPWSKEQMPFPFLLLDYKWILIIPH